jgi:hypothetical protein
LDSHISFSIGVYLTPLTTVILILTHVKIKLNKTLCEQNVVYLQKDSGFVLVLFGIGHNSLIMVQNNILFYLTGHFYMGHNYAEKLPSEIEMSYLP